MISYSQKAALQRAATKKLKKPARWLTPLNIEKKYKRILQSLVREINRAVNEILVPLIPQLLNEVESLYPRKDSSEVKIDDFLDILNGAMLSIAEFIAPKVQQTITQSQQIAIEISNFNEQQFQKVNRSVFGIDIFIDQPWLSDQLELFASQNASLIESLPQQDLSQISEIVKLGLQQGQRFTETAKEIQERRGITRRRANFIARDQTAKLNSSLTRLRQQSAGINRYEWQTSLDERVRPSHKMMEGKICNWDNPNVWLNEKTGKWVPRKKGAVHLQVGQDFNCRCVGLPIFDDILI